MRMWDVDPILMCNQHLRGEHVEMHMFVGTLNKNISIQGYIDKGLLDPLKINKRHDILVDEMLERGGNHKSPLPTYTLDRKWEQLSKIDKNYNIWDLCNRCPYCCYRIYTHFIYKQCEGIL